MEETDHALDGVRRCFVIGPIGNRHAAYQSPERDAYEGALEVYEKVIIPACAAVGIDPVRADQISMPGEITEQVFRRLRDDEVVIADVSGANANVMYELGLRHTTGRLTLQIGEFGQLPFDISSIRTIQFSRSQLGLIDARKELILALEAGLVGAMDTTAAQRIWREMAAPKIESEDAAGPLSEVGTDEDDSGILERLDAIEGAFPRLIEVMVEIESTITEIGTITERIGAEVVDLNSTGGTAKARLVLLARYAQEIDPPSRRLEGSVDTFSATMESLDAEILGIIRYMRTNAAFAGGDGTNHFADMIVGLSDWRRARGVRWKALAEWEKQRLGWAVLAAS